MPFDIVAFVETQQATALSGVAAVADQIYRVSGDDLYVKARAPYLGALLQLGVTTPKYCEVRQPSLLIPYRFYKAALTTVVDHRAGLSYMFGRPLPLYEGEKMNVYLQNATDEYSAIVAWLVSGKCPLSIKDEVDPTHEITGYADSTLTVNIWNDVTITWDQDLPEGRYAVVGMKVGSYLATCNPIAARLVLLDNPWRPGVVTTEITADKTNFVNNLTGLDQEWPLMPEISFKHDQMPNLQILSLTADTDHVVELTLQKIE